jgi:hypothetical protein
MGNIFWHLQYPALRHWARQGIKVLLGSLVLLVLGAWSAPRAQQAGNKIEEINTEFRFLGAEDTLLLHEEEGKLSGQIDVYQNNDESDDVLTYDLTLGSRKNDHVEFKTAEIHRKYYRFNGAAERGSGHEEKDADHLRLIGDLEIITVRGDSGEESVERKQVVLKSLSASEISDE